MIAGWLWVGLAWAGAQDSYEAGVSALRAGEHERAATHLIAALEEGGQSPAVYHALGNALYRETHRGHAMAAWRRGLRLQPSNADLIANVEHAQQQSQDRSETPMDEVGPFFWLRWMSARASGVVSSVLGTLGIVGVALHWRGRRALGLAIGCLVFSAVFAVSVWHAEHSGRTAVVVVDAITAKSTPIDGGVTLFALHEGAEVRVVERGDNAMSLVGLSDGRKGWLPDSALQSTMPDDPFWMPWAEE